MSNHWTAEDTKHFTPEIIARYLGDHPSWTFSMVSLEAAMNYYHPEGPTR